MAEAEPVATPPNFAETFKLLLDSHLQTEPSVGIANLTIYEKEL
jgi:hypothetical protein